MNENILIPISLLLETIGILEEVDDSAYNYEFQQDYDYVLYSLRKKKYPEVCSGIFFAEDEGALQHLERMQYHRKQRELRGGFQQDELR